MEKNYYIPSKSYEEWKEEWIVLNCDSSKEHCYEYVYKISQAGRILLYEQCQVCGMRKSTNKLKHDTVPYLKYKIETNQIKKFSQEKEDNGATYQRYYNEFFYPEREEFNRKKQEENQQKQEKYILESQEKHRLWLKDHNEYLQTSKWKNIRQKVLKRDNFLCQGCLEKPATEVHHLTYEHHKDELMFELISLCYNCHQIKIHKKC